MKTVVVFKWIRDPQDARVASDGVVSWPNVKFSPTDDDPAAMDIARSLASEEEIVGLTIGDGKPEWAAARGASSTVILEDVFGGSDGTAAALPIAAEIKAMGDVDVVAIGDSEWDRGVVSALIGALGWNAYAGVISAEPDGDGVKLAVKSAEGSTIIHAETPVVIAAQAMSQEQNVPGMKQTLAARKKPVEKVSSDSLGVSKEGKSTSVGTSLPEGDSAIIFDGTDPEDAVNQLIEALRSEAVL